ncbi:response regulator [Pseudonocardia sp. GCM10023141]|uniref:response regulator n=1 Tax=Pseudonocardia sp. GCM10023141 TaxID=3252653 RepID=UPI0036D276EA
MIVDDHPFLRESLARLLELEDEFDVVAQCIDGRDAVETADRVMLDVIVMDLQMPVMNGADATSQILSDHPEIVIIILTASPRCSLAERALRAGARHCLSKSAPYTLLFDAIREA